MKWKIRPCFFDTTKCSIMEEYDREYLKSPVDAEIVTNIDECFEGIADSACYWIETENHTWETCPHGKSQLVEEDDGL